MACWGDKLRTGCGIASWLCHPLEVAGSRVGDLSSMEATGMEGGFWREGREDQAVNCWPPPSSDCYLFHLDIRKSTAFGCHSIEELLTKGKRS